ncbi:MAG: FkbM family methyltransferase [Maricaulaceae bacterium]
MELGAPGGVGFGVFGDHGLFLPLDDGFYAPDPNADPARFLARFETIAAQPPPPDTRILLGPLFDAFPRASFVDVGAYVGAVYVPALKLIAARGEDRAALALEPGPSRSLIEHSLSANRLAGPISDAAAGVVSGPVFLWTPAGGGIAARLGVPQAPTAPRQIVRAALLSEELNRFGITGDLILKVDVEGAEAAVLDGLPNWDRIRAALLEAWPEALRADHHGQSFAETLIARFVVYDIGDTLAPRYVRRLATVEAMLAAAHAQPRGNTDLLLIAREERDAQAAVEARAEPIAAQAARFTARFWSRPGAP